MNSLPEAPQGWHWVIVGYTCVAPQQTSDHCQAAFKASSGRRCECQQRACCDLAERNARLWISGKISQSRLQELNDDLRGYCTVAFQYQQWLMDQPGLWLAKCKNHFRQTLKQRKQWLQSCGNN